ncbi:MAG TPA: DUF4157 domain-containing protein [Polyangiaceae bacterium]
MQFEHYYCAKSQPLLHQIKIQLARPLRPSLPSGIPGEPSVRPLQIPCRFKRQDLGDHDNLSGVTLQTETLDRIKAKNSDALAYAAGEELRFAPGLLPARSFAQLFLVGHELTHAAQQRKSGVRTLQCFTRFAPDEQLADVSMGWKHPSAKPLRVSDDGQMVCEDNGWNPGTNKLAWTTPTLVAQSNAQLSAQGSAAKLETVPGHEITGKSPMDGSPSTLVQVAPSGGTSFSLPSDCGSAARVVMGSHSEDVAVLRDPTSGGVSRTQPQPYVGGWSFGTHNPTAAQHYMVEVLAKEFGTNLSQPELYARYAALSPDEKTAFDKKYGINEYAAPEVGQGLTISTEPDMPGFAIHPGMQHQTRNFHYAGVVLKSGGDYVTLESAAGWDPADWIFFMYGSAQPAQSFHREHEESLTHGTHHTSFIVEPEERKGNQSTKNNRHLVMLDLGTSLNGPSALVLTPTYRIAFANWLSNRLRLDVGVGARISIPTSSSSSSGPALAGDATLGMSYGFGPSGHGPFISVARGVSFGTIANESEVRARGTLLTGVGYDFGGGRVGIYLDVLTNDSKRDPLLANIALGAGFSF